MESKVSEPRIIVALDFPGEHEALRCVEGLDPARCRLKVGKELYTRCGPAIVRRLREAGHEVFLDLKFHDIPNTVAGACAAAAELGCWMVNVHASGGRAMLEAAVDAVKRSNPDTLLVAVTVLTSLDAEQLAEVGFNEPPDVLVQRLAALAQDCGLDGVVCSAREAGMLRAARGAGFCLVTPGIRPSESGQDDQRRVATPAGAIAAGASYLVVGRPITRAADPGAALAAIDAAIAGL